MFVRLIEQCSEHIFLFLRSQDKSVGKEVRRALVVEQCLTQHLEV